jgi:hypothetical protein
MDNVQKHNNCNMIYFGHSDDLLQVVLSGTWTFLFITVWIFDSHYPSTRWISAYHNNLVLCGHSSMPVTKINSVNQTKLNHWISWIPSSRVKPPERQADHSRPSTSKNRKIGVDSMRVCVKELVYLYPESIQTYWSWNRFNRIQWPKLSFALLGQEFGDTAGNNKSECQECYTAKKEQRQNDYEKWLRKVAIAKFSDSECN